MSKLTCVLFTILLAVSLCEAAVHRTHISYPATESNDLCTITKNGSKIAGKCKSFKNCPTAVNLWTEEGTQPKTCYFNKFEHIVCCPENATVSPAVTTVLPDSTTSIDFTSLLPKENDSCSLGNGSKSMANGTCKKFLDCPSEIDLWKKDRRHPEVCIDNIVCCPYDETISLIKSDVQKLRRSDRECSTIYGPSFWVITSAIGMPALPREFPYMVALGWSSNFGDTIDFNCGGVLISSRFVLTAAHCTSLRGVSPIMVRVGGENLTDSSVQKIDIKRIIDHPKYEANSYHDDIALIELEQEARQDPACIWSSTLLEQNNLTALGYGNTKFAGPSSDQLIKAALFEVPNSMCATNYETDIFDTQLCAGNSKQKMDTCQGDSGGPLLMYKDTKFYPYVVGVTSFGNPCGGESPGIYTRVSSYIDWIEKIVWK